MTAGHQNVTPNSTNNAEEDEVVATPAWLWAVVIGLGIAIVGMFVLIGYKVVKGDNKKKTPPIVATQPQMNPSSTQPVAVVQAGALPHGFKDLIIERPDGLPLNEASLQGGYLMLRFSGDRTDYLIFVNNATGAISKITIPATK